jgi:peroxiredoxin
MLLGAWSSQAPALSPVGAGEAAPAFVLTDTGGKEWKLADLKGKVVVLEWTNPNCPFVQRVYRDGIMPELQKQYQGKDVVWLAVNSTNTDHADFENGDELKKTYADWKAGFSALLLDPDGRVGKSYGAKTTPHLYVIDRTGKIAYSGALDDDGRGNKTERVNYLGVALDEVLAGKAVTTVTTRPYGCSVKY